MAHQEAVNGGPSSPVNGVLEGIGGLGTNVVRLTTLQARLAMEDFRESRGRALPALIAAVVLTLMAFASTTVALMGLAYWMAAGWAIPLGKALMLVAAAGMVLTLLLTAFVVHSLRASFVSFRRSREELERNIAWLQTVLLRSGR